MSSSSGYELLELLNESSGSQTTSEPPKKTSNPRPAKGQGATNNSKAFLSVSAEQHRIDCTTPRETNQPTHTYR